MEYSAGQQSHQGGRDYNEDSTGIFERDDAVLLVVADGLGGHEGGEVASQCFVETMGDSFAKATPAQLDKAQSFLTLSINCLLYTSPSPRDLSTSRMPSSA